MMRLSTSNSTVLNDMAPQYAVRRWPKSQPNRLDISSRIQASSYLDTAGSLLGGGARLRPRLKALLSKKPVSLITAGHKAETGFGKAAIASPKSRPRPTDPYFCCPVLLQAPNGVIWPKKEEEKKETRGKTGENKKKKKDESGASRDRSDNSKVF